ncbi:MAG: TolC family protein [Deltaproteobacteria bacterium]|nr:TolC family protein [Deltaproteobacteria bacterium]
MDFLVLVRRSVRVFALAGVLLASPASAQSTVRDGVLWTDASVAARAAQHSPEVSRARTGLYEAQALSAFTSLPRIGNPTVGVRAMVGAPDLPAATYSLLVGMPIEVSGAPAQWRHESRWAVREAEGRIDLALNEACAEARQAWVDAAAAQAALVLVQDQFRTANQLLSATQARVQAQTATALDLALAEQEVHDAEAARLTAQRERDDALGRMRELLALDPREPVAVSELGTLTIQSEMTRERAIALALQNRRELTVLGASAARSRVSQTRLHHQATAPIFIAAEVEWQGYSTASVGASAQWSLPVSLTNQGERAAAEAQARAADEQRTIAENSLANQAAIAWDQLAHRLEELALLDTRALPTAQRVFSLTEALFRAGTVDSYRLLRARDEVYQQQQRRLDALRSAWRARVQLDRATGRASNPS